ncbi:hypothetical protein ABZ479_20590 [Streptomyces sp. NPDC005722]
MIGRERHTSRWIAIDMATRDLRNFRPKPVYAPRVLERLREAGRGHGFGATAETVSATLELYAHQYRDEAG